MIDYFAMLTRDEQHAAIHRMANSGMHESTIAATTRLTIDMIHTIIADRSGSKPSDSQAEAAVSV